jgi:hypothetical protein
VTSPKGVSAVTPLPEPRSLRVPRTHDSLVLGRSLDFESGVREGLAYVRPQLSHFGMTVIDALQRSAASHVVVDLHVRREAFERPGVIA